MMPTGIRIEKRYKLTSETNPINEKEMFVQYSNFLPRLLPVAGVCAMLVASGCLATRDWVQTWTNEQLFPINKRVSDTEANLTKTDGRVTQVDARVDTMAKQIATLEARLGQTDAKANLALESLQRLKPERKMVLNFTAGPHFATNSAQFSAQAKKDIDSFLSDVKGQSDDGSALVFVVAGHTDADGCQAIITNCQSGAPKTSRVI
jgi:hypothetical protein